MIIEENYNDWEVFTSWIKGVLQTTEPSITFTKKDGTERIMRCTLRSELLPITESTEPKRERKTNADIISVFDLESKSWKSFTIKSVKKVDIPTETE